MWDVGVARKYSLISLEIHLCKRCVNQKWKWFGAAGVAVLLGLLGVSPSNLEEPISLPAMFMFFVAFILIYVGGRKPVKILRFDEEMNSLKIKISNDSIARLVTHASTKR